MLISTFSRNAAFVRCLLSSCAQLHKKAISSILFSPIKFFDSTPSGRIVNRFSRDLFYVDEICVSNFTDSIMFVLLISGYTVSMIYIVPINIAAVGVFVGIVYLLFCISFEHIRDLRRMDLIYRSPITSNFNTTVSGLINIRCYG